MPRFTNAKDLQKYLKKAADATVAESLITVQARLGSARTSPYDTGRFRSSWFASEGSPSTEVADVDANSPNEDANSLKVDARKTYYLTNSLDYAQSVTIEGNVVSKPKTWWKDFRESTVPKLQRLAAQTVKKEFDL